jgi:hypothetical protein
LTAVIKPLILVSAAAAKFGKAASRTAAANSFSDTFLMGISLDI